MLSLLDLSIMQIAQINLGLQAFLAVLLVVSYWFKRMKKFRIHGSLMLTAVVLNAFSFLLVMGPSFLGYYDSNSILPFRSFSILLVTHASLGAIVEGLGIYLVASWRLRSSTQSCIRKKKLMDVIFPLWLFMFYLGFLLYTMSYPI